MVLLVSYPFNISRYLIWYPSNVHFCIFSFVIEKFLTSIFSTVLDTPVKLGKILVGMNKALGDIPLTVKLRTGVKDGKNTAHKLMPRLGSEWQIGAMTVREIQFGRILNGV